MSLIDDVVDALRVHGASVYRLTVPGAPALLVATPGPSGHVWFVAVAETDDPSWDWGDVAVETVRSVDDALRLIGVLA